ncbi:Alpha/beta hydrolase family-domain-containing protein [Phakopsora pachyrhizi]|uniref:Alpha/beta hydrolase family-domain-containing protein n=1 Tax=Phakopsora pachyrhizi TaxID=170000 RepID=A0AAV0BRC7_PHAPC|nr:Alpha/beta hydrolase family-domain-containing protein [Phakopsora pachyrhizi]CAH7689061.1 Alpha/beta hydrolase family-domain-containing protein [Phakopsora pachyrhizi]
MDKTKLASCHRPRVPILLPLSKPSQSSPSSQTLERLERYCRRDDEPFRDISLSKDLVGWRLSTHIFPAAYPRSIRGSASASSSSSSSRPLRVRSFEKSVEAANGASAARKLRKEISEAQRTQPGVKVEEPQLFVCLNRYYRKEGVRGDRPTGKNDEGQHPTLTLLLAHANGFHKETWEPTLAQLLVSPAGRRVEEVWSFDAVNHGDSALINDGNLTYLFDWADMARDMLQFVLLYLPDRSKINETLPKVLESTDQRFLQSEFLMLDRAPVLKSTKTLSIDVRRRIEGLRDRNLTWIGHSMGGCAAGLAGTSLPELFEELVLIDPVMGIHNEQWHQHTSDLASLTTRRRDSWSNREEAGSKLRSNVEFFGRWNPSALNRYIKFGMIEKDFFRGIDQDGGTGSITLKCDRLSEASVFVDPFFRYQDFYHRLAKLSNDEPRGLNWSFIFAGPNRSVVQESIINDHQGFSKNLKSVRRIDGAGHLIVQEKPIELGTEISRLLSDDHRRSKVFLQSTKL